MKNILYITENLDFFADSGAKIKTINTLDCLNKEFKVNVLSLNSSSKINKIPKNIGFDFVVDKNIEIPVKKRLKELFVQYLRGNPYYFFQYQNKDFKKLVNKKIKELKPDIIHIDHLTMAQYLPNIKNEKWVFEEHNVEHKLRFQMSKFSKKIGYHWLIWLFEGILLYFKEVDLWKKFDYIFAISNDDKRFISKKTNRNNVVLQNIYIPLKPRKTNKKNRNILFIGDLEWLPNRNGVEWFIENVFPKLKDAKLNLVGRVDEKFKKENTKKNIRFLGYQKEIKPFFENNSVFIAPLLIGEGVRLKILDAFSRKIPVVSTKQAIKGISVKNKQELYVAINKQQFANHIENVFGQKTKNILDKAMVYIKNNHSDAENKKFIKNYKKILNKQ